MVNLLCEDRTLQDVKASSSSISHSAEDGEAGSEGCLPSGPNSPRSISSSLPVVQMAGEDLSIQMPPFWSCTSDVYQTAEASTGLTSPGRYTLSHLSGQYTY